MFAREIFITLAGGFAFHTSAPAQLSSVCHCSAALDGAGAGAGASAGVSTQGEQACGCGAVEQCFSASPECCGCHQGFAMLMLPWGSAKHGRFAGAGSDTVQRC